MTRGTVLGVHGDLGGLGVPGDLIPMIRGTVLSPGVLGVLVPDHIIPVWYTVAYILLDRMSWVEAVAETDHITEVAAMSAAEDRVWSMEAEGHTWAPVHPVRTMPEGIPVETSEVADPAHPAVAAAAG